MFPNGGIAPGLQVGNASLNSVSDARRSLRSEFDLAVSRKTCLAIARQVEDVPERRYCAWLAGWKRVTEFCLGCKTQLEIGIRSRGFEKDLPRNSSAGRRCSRTAVLRLACRLETRH